MTFVGTILLLTVLAPAALGQQVPAPRVVGIESTDGTVLNGTYFATARPGSGVIQFHQSHRTRRSREAVAIQLAAAGINTLTLDARGYGESDGKSETRKTSWAEDLEAAFQFLATQPGVQREGIGFAGADAVETAQRHREAVKSVVLLSGAPASSWTNTEPYRGEIRRGATKVLQQVGSTPSSSQALGDSFRDCPECPEMVVITAGRFTMGSSDAEKNWAASHGGSLKSVADEAPQHDVSLASFALGKYDVTRAEYTAFVRATGRPSGDGCGHDSFKWDKDPNLSWEDPGFKQSDRDPVVCVSWNDAQAYVSWLNGKTAHAYRLPTEAEWEYTARAGTTTKFWWGDDDGAAPVHAWFKDNSDGQTHPVGGKPANGFGLYDMVGNVWQWTQDCYAESYTGAPTNGRAREGKSDCLRVDRGGSWMYPAWLLRSATRERNPADFRDRIMGFRVARSLP